MGGQHYTPKAIPLSVCVNLQDIEAQGRRALSHRAWTYFSSGSEDYSAMRADLEDLTRIRFRPRVLRNVERIDMSRRIMGWKSSLPFFIAPTALVKLADPEGEVSLLRGAARRRIPYCVSTIASVAHEHLCETWTKDLSNRTCLFFQLYVPKEERKARETIRMAKKLGYQALVVTVDTPVVGKREDDERDKLQLNHDGGIVAAQDLGDDDACVEKPVLRGVNSATLNWNDMKWIRGEWGHERPIVIKGIGSAEDANIARSLGFTHLYLSNHGGRQLASAPSSLSTLLEIRSSFPEVIRDCEIYVDGGFRRGSDIVKALCLGATAVGMGRPFLYGLGAFGVDGVVKVIKSKS
jgi:L-lactate dehydrogenase (cytochrome)